jgi:hypothetical protein
MLTVSDPLAVNYMIGPHHVYDFPKPEGGRKWFLNLVRLAPWEPSLCLLSVA